MRLRHELKQREGKMIESLLQSSQFVFTTVTSAAKLRKFDLVFDVLVVDEAAMVLEVGGRMRF